MQKRVGILRGGAGDLYHASLKKGGEIISHIFGLDISIANLLYSIKKYIANFIAVALQ